MAVASKNQMTKKRLGAVLFGGALLSSLAAVLLAGKGGQTEPVAPAAEAPDAPTTATSTSIPTPRQEAVMVNEKTSPSVVPPPAETAVEVVDESAKDDDSEDDPYEISDFISEPPDDGKIHGSTEAPLTAAEDEPEPEPAVEETTAAADPASVAIANTAAPASTRVDAPAIRAPYSGSCPSGNSAASPAGWLSLSAEQRLAFPRPTLSITSYSSQPQRRFVMVGRQIFREGQALPSGAALLRIQPKTLVLSSAGCAVEIPTRLTLR